MLSLPTPELDQLHDVSSITITPSNLSITSQLLCAKKITITLAVGDSVHFENH